MYPDWVVKFKVWLKSMRGRMVVRWLANAVAILVMLVILRIFLVLPRWGFIVTICLLIFLCFPRGQIIALRVASATRNNWLPLGILTCTGVFAITLWQYFSYYAEVMSPFRKFVLVELVERCSNLWFYGYFWTTNMILREAGLLPIDTAKEASLNSMWWAAFWFSAAAGILVIVFVVREWGAISERRALRRRVGGENLPPDLEPAGVQADGTTTTRGQQLRERSEGLLRTSIVFDIIEIVFDFVEIFGKSLMKFLGRS